MQLLDPTEIIDEKVKIRNYSQERTQKLAEEENRLVRLVNTLRDKYDLEIKQIKEETESYRNESELKKSILLQELANIEDKRKELLKPIENIKKSAEIMLIQAKEREKDAQRAEQGFIKRTTELQEEFKKIEKRGQILDQWQIQLKDRDDQVKGVELSTRLAHNELFGEKGEWARLIESVATNDQKSETLKKKEIKIATETEAINILITEQNEKERLLKSQDRELIEIEKRLSREVENNNQKQAFLLELEAKTKQREKETNEAYDKIFGKDGEWERVKEAMEANDRKSKILSEKEEKIKTDERSIEIRKQEQDKREQELNDENKAIKSNYQALSQAKTHLGIK
jgi:hypothetical protein